MTIEVALLIAGASCLCAFLGYQKGIRKDSQRIGRQEGHFSTDLEYLKNIQTTTLLVSVKSHSV